MIANQKLKASDGYEVCLFPCETLYLTEARDPDEHDVLALDFLPYNITGVRITAMPCYAPFSGTIVYTGADHNCILESDDLVHMPDGSLEYGRVLVAHSFTAPVLNTHYDQGDLFYRTGNYGQSQGEHLHMEVGHVSSKSAQYWNTGGIGIYGAIHMWNAMYVNNTVLLRPETYNWVEWNVTPTTDTRKKGFPWFITARKRRENYLYRY